MLGGLYGSHGLSGHWKYINVIWRIINCHLFNAIPTSVVY